MAAAQERDTWLQAVWFTGRDGTQTQRRVPYHADRGFPPVWKIAVMSRQDPTIFQLHTYRLEPGVPRGHYVEVVDE